MTYITRLNGGIATVAIDGSTVDQLDTYSGARLFQQQKTYTVATGVHTVTVTVSGNKNAASSGAFVLFDAFTVAAAAPPPPPPPPASGAVTYEDTHRPPSSTLFPYTTLFRSGNSGGSAKFSG